MSESPENNHSDRPVLGMMCAVGAFFMFAVMNVFAKLLSENHHVVELGFYRNIIALMPMLFIIYALKRGDIVVIKSSPWKIIIRSILGTISLVITFWAFSLLPMADATALLFTASLFVPILGYFVLKEYVGPYRWGAILVGFAGVLYMLQPTGDVNITGVIVALSAAGMHTILQTILRSLGKTESPQTVTFYFIFIGTFVSLIPMPLVFKIPAWTEVPYIIGLGLTGVIAQFLLSIAYKYAQASIVTVFNYSGIIWATLFGWAIWNEWPTSTILTGGVIVIASNVFIVYREQKLARARVKDVSVHKTNVM